MTKEELDAIRDRHAKATPGIWRIWGSTIMAPKDPTTDSANVDHNFPVADTYCVRDGKPRSFDATFIAQAHQDIPDLLAEIDRLSAALSEIAESHVPSQPMACNGVDETAWVMQHVGRLRGIAVRTLNPPKPAAFGIGDAGQ